MLRIPAVGLAVARPARVTVPPSNSPLINMVEPAPILNSPLALFPPPRSTLHPMTTLLLPASTL